MVGGNIALSNLNIELDGNVAEGVLTYATGGRRTLQGTLAVDTLDLTPYASAMRLLAADARAWNRMPIALDWFDDIDVDLRVSAARVIAAQSRLGRTAVAATLSNRRLVVTVGESQALQRRHQRLAWPRQDERGRASAARSCISPMSISTPVSPISSAFAGSRARAICRWRSTPCGDSVLALTRTLNGSATLAGAGGR